MFRLHVVLAVFSRNFKQYFTSVLGYLFIFVFVTLCAILAFSPQFFVDNLANLDQLSAYFPVLLLFLIPAITMSVWADEKRQGTDAILFTLPASDAEILGGKYLAVVAVYTVALFFSGTQLVALATLGSPDWGVIGTTYAGYWLAGLSMLAIGMFASSLTKSTTVAFVIGAILCALPVMIGYVFAGNQGLEAYGVGPQLRDFTIGLISLPGVVYFTSITVLMLYLNLVVISKRHWSRGQSPAMAGHFTARVLALAISLVALNVLADRSSALLQNRVDLTAEQLYSLDETTRSTIAAAAKNKRPITIQAFISPEVPAKYVNTRKRLIGLLRQYERLGTGNIDVRIVDVRPNSDQIDEARSLGIVPLASRDTVAGKVVEQDVYLGAVITSTLDEVTLPFIDGDTSIEYQLTRSIATTTNEAQKLRLGILRTDAHFSNLEVQGRIYDWTAPTTLEELAKQYKLVNVDPAELPACMADGKDDNGGAKPADGAVGADASSGKKIDVLMVVDPSSLTRSGIFNLVSWIEAGKPTLILADPLPFHWFTYQAPRELGIINAPASPRISPQSMWAQVATTGEPKAENGTAASLLEVLGITWKHDRVVWSLNNPHLSFKPVFPERLGRRWPENYGPRDAALLFARAGGNYEVFNRENPISAGLQEVLLSYAGSLAPLQNAKTRFEPLITLKPGTAGHYDWDEITEDLVMTRQEVNRFTGQLEQVTGPVPSRYTGNNIRVLRNSPKLARVRQLTAQESSNDSAAPDTGETSSKAASNG
jgi:ABC-2 type transport system permease protein